MSTEQRTWNVADERREDALAEAKRQARADGFDVVTLCRMDLVGRCWRVTLAVRPKAVAA